MNINYYKNTVNIFAHTSVPWQQDILFDFLKKLKLKADSSTLDVGSGIGNNIGTLLEFFNNITATDISKGALRLSSEKFKNNNINFEVANLQKMPFADNSFDLVICTEVIEHCENPVEALKELKRILKKDGYLIISAPNYFNFAGLYKSISEKMFNRLWDAWGNHENGVENFITCNKLKKYFNNLNLEIIADRGGDLIRSWLPFFKKYYNFIDKHPSLRLNKKWPFKLVAMNYFCILRKSN